MKPYARPPSRAPASVEDDQRQRGRRLLAPVERRERGGIGDAEARQLVAVAGREIAGVDAAGAAVAQRRDRLAGVRVDAVEVGVAVVGEEEQRLDREQQRRQRQRRHGAANSALATIRVHGPARRSLFWFA